MFAKLDLFTARGGGIRMGLGLRLGTWVLQQKRGHGDMFKCMSADVILMGGRRGLAVMKNMACAAHHRHSPCRPALHVDTG